MKKTEKEHQHKSLLFEEYQTLYTAYHRLWKIYELCDERFDYDIIYKLNSQIQDLEDKISRLEDLILGNKPSFRPMLIKN